VIAVQCQMSNFPGTCRSWQKQVLFLMRWWCSHCTRYHARLDFYIHIVLAHWSNSPQVDMLLPSDIIFSLWVSQSLLLFLSANCLAEKQQIPILLSFVWHDGGLQPTIYHTRGEPANHYTTDVVSEIKPILMSNILCLKM
jgi:hypothetical protein